MKSSPSTSVKSDSSAGSKAKLYGIGALVLLILGAVLYFVGLQAGKAQLSAQAAKFGVERNGLQSQLTTAEAARDAALDRASLQEARAALYRTTIDLDARNFGTANTHLRESATALSRVKAPDTAALQSQISATDLNVAVNLGGQRQKILGFANQLNALVPAPTDAVPTGATAPTASDPSIEGAPAAPSMQ